MPEFKEQPDTDEQINSILNPLVKQWFYSRFQEFSLPQKFGVNEIHTRQNILISAPTGATKTLTAFLSILNELVDSSEKGKLEDKVYCIYVSPLKALNYDIEVNLNTPLKEMEKLAGKELGIRVGVRTGDTTPYEKQKMLKHPPHILITTPESLAIILSSSKFSTLLKGVEWVVVDEIHSLAESKRGVHLSLSMERLQRISGYICRVGLSATVAPLTEVAKYLVGYESSKEGKGSLERPCKIVDVQFIKKMDLKVLCPVPNFLDISHEDMHHAMYVLMDSLIQSHKTTLIFTNTRAATERVVDNLKDKFPKNYTMDNIGAHHGSLSKKHRLNIENKLRNGELKCVVCSTSLELGIDIGYVDLVVLLGSPKSVARGLQRIGRSGHKLHDTTKGRIIVLDRDDLVECSVLLKSAIEKKIDKIHLPRNSLDVLAQQIFGIAIEEQINVDELFDMVRKSYCYHTLLRTDFNELIDYLAGKFVSLEERNVYAKIWHDEETGMIGKRGKLARVLYMTNIGTIPDETKVLVKLGDQVIGTIDEGFLEKLKNGDVFVLGGDTYEFMFSRGMVAQVRGSSYRPPTVPQWFSEMLPLSFDLAMEIGRFRRLMDDKFANKKTKQEIVDFILSFLYVDDNGADSIYEYFKEQYLYAQIPHDKKIVIEQYKSERGLMYIFHTLYGRRVNDCLSRAVGFVVSKQLHKDVELGINDNGFYIMPGKTVDMVGYLKMLKPDKLDLVMKLAIDKTEVLKRRFRHCATRSLMILRSYMGRQKRVGRQQVSSMILMNSLKLINPDFTILKEARREVLEDLMDIENTKLVLQMLEKNEVKIVQIETQIPSPFAFNLATQGYADILKMEDRIEFLRRMHQMVLAKISLKK